MTNYEKAITKAKGKITAQKILGKTYEEIQRYIMGMKQAFKVAEFLDADELEEFYDECMNEILEY